MSTRVHLLYETDRYGNPHGSGHIRLLRPFSHPALTDTIDVTSGDGLPGERVDIVLVERGWRAAATMEEAEALVDSVRRIGAKLIYTLDDNLLDLHRWQPWHEFSTDAKRNIVRFFLRQADVVVVTTESLKQRLMMLNRSIYVLPNALDERLFLPEGVTHFSAVERKRDNGVGEPLIVGYMGTHSHSQDLMMVLEPLRAVMRRHPGKVEFQIVGVTEDSRVVQSFSSLPFRILDTQGNHFYPKFIPWARRNLNWDIAIAPLADNAFTHSKSDIKFLDYGLLGIPGIYSEVEAYCHSVEHGKTGLLCKNSPIQWGQALADLLDNRDLRRRLAQSAFEYVSAKRLLRHCAENWKHVVSLVLR